MDIQKQIEVLQEQAEELSDLREDVFNVKADITVTAVGLLLKKLNGYISDMIEVSSEKKYYDEDLCDTLKTTISEAITAFSKIQPPTINVEPKINVDLKPIQNAFTEINKQNQSMLGLMEKMYNGNKSDELYRLVIAMVGKNNAFLEKSFQQIDNTPQLKYIGEGVNKKFTEWKIGNIVRGAGNVLMEATIKVTK